MLCSSVVLWRCYIGYELNIAHDPSAARRIFFRAIHACPWWGLVFKISYLSPKLQSYKGGTNVFFLLLLQVVVIIIIWFIFVNVCTRSKRLWLDAFLKLNSVLTGKELSDLQEVMRDKEINLRTDIYEILLQESWPLFSRIQLIELLLAWYDANWCKILSKMFMQS